MPSVSEMVHFYWYCATVARLVDFPETTATRAVLQFAVRRATVVLTGSTGVPFASVKAMQQRQANGGVWEGCGLRKEHAIPVALVCNGIIAKLAEEHSGHSLDEAKNRLDAALSELAALAGKSDVFKDFPDDPRVALVVETIRASTAIAWLTEQEDIKLRKKLPDGGSLIKRMPPDWDGRDPLARYRCCGIEVRPINDWEPIPKTGSE